MMREGLLEMILGMELPWESADSAPVVYLGLQLVVRKMELQSVHNQYVWNAAASQETVISILLGNRFGQTSRAWNGNQGRLILGIKGQF